MAIPAAHTSRNNKQMCVEWRVYEEEKGTTRRRREKERKKKKNNVKKSNNTSIWKWDVAPDKCFFFNGYDVCT